MEEKDIEDNKSWNDGYPDNKGDFNNF